MSPLGIKDTSVASVIRFLFRRRRFKGRNFAIRLLLRIASVAPSRYGPLLRVRMLDFTNTASLLGYYGDEIPDQIRKLASHDVFIDIGANTGVFSLVACDIVKDGFVFAFEPNPHTFADLSSNILANGRSNIVGLNLAISGVSQLFAIKHNRAHSGGTSLKKLRKGPLAPINSSDEHLIVAIAPQNLEPLLEVTRERRIGIKIDVEGHEHNVLQGLFKAGLLDRTDWVIVEIDEKNLRRHNASISDIYELMRNIGFSPSKGERFSEHYDEIFLAK